MSAYELRHRARRALTTLIEQSKASLAEGEGYSLDQIRVLQGTIRGLNIAIQTVEETYRQMGGSDGDDG